MWIYDRIAFADFVYVQKESHFYPHLWLNMHVCHPLWLDSSWLIMNDFLQLLLTFLPITLFHVVIGRSSCALACLTSSWWYPPLPSLTRGHTIAVVSLRNIVIGSMLASLQMSSFLMWSFLVLPLDHLSILFSVVSCLTWIPSIQTGLLAWLWFCTCMYLIFLLDRHLLIAPFHYVTFAKQQQTPIFCTCHRHVILSRIRELSRIRWPNVSFLWIVQIRRDIFRPI